MLLIKPLVDVVIMKVGSTDAKQHAGCSACGLAWDPAHSDATSAGCLTGFHSQVVGRELQDAPVLDADVHPGEPYIMVGYSSTSASSACGATGRPSFEDSASVVHGRCVSRSAMPAEFMCLPEVGSDFMAMPITHGLLVAASQHR